MYKKKALDWIFIFLIIIISMIVMYTSDEYSLEESKNTPPKPEDVIRQKYCYCVVNGKVYTATGTDNISQIVALREYYQTVLDSQSKNFIPPHYMRWKGRIDINKGRKVQIVEETEDFYSKVWFHEGRLGAGYVYIPKKCLHDSLPKGMTKEPERYYPKNYKGLRHKEYNK